MRLCWAEFELDEDRFELRRGGVKVPVQPKVLELLFELVRARERVVLRRELFDSVWAGIVVSEASLSRAVLEARRAIGDELQQVLITVRGRGFRFAAEVVERGADGAAAPAELVHGTADPSFVGREAAMTCLAARLDEAKQGQGSLVWLSGEAGIGKTRTADELGRRARASGAAVFSANAHESPPAPQFWLWAQAMRGHATAQGGARAAQLLEGASSLVQAPTQPIGDASLFVLFDTFTRLFLDASRSRPQVFLFDDAHWADEGSLKLLAFFARETRHAAIVLVCTYRDTEQTSDPRARAFGTLLGECSGLPVPLRGLSPTDIPRFVEVTSGVTPTDSFARALFDRTGGNPLYLRQVLQTEWAERALTETAHQLASSMDLQQGLVESIHRHLEGVSREARDLLTLAAVLGREFAFPELAAVSELPQATLLDQLDEGARARILLKSKTGAYSFTHALVHDVLYKSLSTSARASRHARIAERLLSYFGASLDAHVDVLATHFLRALPGGSPERAFELAARAAQLATASGADDVAAQYWNAATHALTYLAADDARHVQARLAAAKSHALAREHETARAAFLDAATLARSFGKYDALAEAALGFAAISNDGPLRRTLLIAARDGLAPGASRRAELEALLPAVG